ncbi:MAG: DNA methyltransferase, partial [Actinomycetaceae bacterium]|nr:DNA methyltransferase [Actinomycetaceae bacterium]MDU0971263.1 DNA methyltransferase [Actinomycetaceae bacterium]
MSDLVKAIIYAEQCPAYVVIVAGGWVAVTTPATWPQGRYLAGNVLLAAQRGDFSRLGEATEMACCFARENVATDAQGECWWDATRDEAIHHTSAVSSELRESVRESVEIIGNDVLARMRAVGLDTTDVDGQQLAGQALRYLYRILFVLFAEADPNLDILPVGVPEYEEGYGLTRIGEVALRNASAPGGEDGRYLYDSLAILFSLIDTGHDPRAVAVNPNASNPGLSFRHLSADLFRPQATALIDRVGLSNAALGRVIEKLLLTKEKSGRDRGFISYATLGINQLGEVYESLMSYTGSVAAVDLVEVAEPGGEGGCWVVPEALALQRAYPDEWFVTQRLEMPGGGWQTVRKHYRPGDFVFRQSSRDRQRSASYYTPEVLTQFTVSQAIEELQASGAIGCAEDVLGLRVCEPALGSGAFAVEAVRQLADVYVKLRQKELGEVIPADDYSAQLQKIKARIALHQVYGVDLNAQAVELAEISLWLDTMTADLQAPWYGLHLRRGNSLIGARYAVYSPGDLVKKAWQKKAPSRMRPGETIEGGVFHFLLPSLSWGAEADTKHVKDIAADEAKALKTWRSKIRGAIPKVTGKRLEGLSGRVEALWRFAAARIAIAEAQVGRDITIWGQPEPVQPREAVTRAQIEAELFGNPDSPYQRLRLVADAWCALTFWPLDQGQCVVNGQVVEPPSLDEWVNTVEALVGVPEQKPSRSRHGKQIEGQLSFSDLSWDDLGTAEDVDLGMHQAKPVHEVVVEHPWLEVCRKVAGAQGFFHWDLDFASVFAAGGFDLQVGNPPWVRPNTDVDELYAETDPWFVLAHKPSQEEVKAKRARANEDARTREIVLAGAGEVAATAAVLRNSADYPYQGGRPNLYRAFMEQTWGNASSQGVVGLIHPDTHFTDPKTPVLREGAYRRLRRHWHFINELMLFGIDDHVQYSVSVYGARREAPGFLHASGLYHPRTAVESLVHDGSGPQPGAKNDDNKWDLSAHAARVQHITADTLEAWRDLVDSPETPVTQARMVYAVNAVQYEVSAKLAQAARVGELGPLFSGGWNEKTDRAKGYFENGWDTPASYDDAILQGPHLGIASALFKQPNPTLKHNQDWTEIDLEAAGPGFIPATAYQPTRDTENGRHYDSDYTHWDIDGRKVPARDYYRIVWRRMANLTSVRTFYPALIPPG